MTRLDREPRNWRQLWAAYLGHFAQGVIAGLALPLVWSPFIFTNYQRAEFDAYWRRNEAGEYKAHDFVSRDLADYLFGYYVGSGVSIAAIVTALLTIA